METSYFDDNTEHSRQEILQGREAVEEFTLFPAKSAHQATE